MNILDRMRGYDSNSPREVTIREKNGLSVRIAFNHFEGMVYVDLWDNATDDTIIENTIEYGAVRELTKWNLGWVTPHGLNLNRIEDDYGLLNYMEKAIYRDGNKIRVIT